jgi:hypothetical protein
LLFHFPERERTVLLYFLKPESGFGIAFLFHDMRNNDRRDAIKFKIEGAIIFHSSFDEGRVEIPVS